MSSQQRIGALDARGWSAESGARLKEAVRAAKWQQEKLAKAAGIARSTLNAIFKGTHTPREATLEAICDVVGIDVDDIIQPQPAVGPADRSQPMPGDLRIGETDYNIVLRREVDVSAGVGRIPLSEAASGGIAFERSWLIKRGIASDLAALVPVVGDSMAPTIPHGANVLMQFTPEITKKGVYIFGRSDQVLIKRLDPLERSEDGRIRSLAIISDNPAYPTEVVSGDAVNDLRIIGRVRTVVADV